MSLKDDIIIQMNYINSDYTSFNDKPKEDLRENKDTPTPNITIDNKNNYEAINEKPYYEQEQKIEPKNSEESPNIFILKIIFIIQIMKYFYIHFYIYLFK